MVNHADETDGQLAPDTRLDWIEPQLRAVDIEETAVLPGRGGHDGETIWTDCTLS